MTMNILESAASLSDCDLLARLEVIAGRSRETTVELIGHLAALDTRAVLYAAEGYGTLFAYCTQVLRLSEDAACSRIAAARACRRFPVILDLLASGAVTLTAVKLVAPHLTEENYADVLERARNLPVRQVEKLVAEIAPRPDAPTSVRKITGTVAAVSAPPPDVELRANRTSNPSPPVPPSPGATAAERRAVIEPTSPARYRVQFTVAQATHDKLRRLQTLLRREIPTGDPAEIVDRALDLLLDKVERTKLAAIAPPRPREPEPQPEVELRSEAQRREVIRLETDDDIRTPLHPSRYIPREVRRKVWRRDGGQCAFVAKSGHRCSETTFLELHHIHAYARGGLATLGNIALRCRRHNQYEAALVFGPRARRDVRGAEDGASPTT
jgi:5-methylcytosine-specific restriction endonuclease McrA